jgi:hypothetical protein
MALAMAGVLAGPPQAAAHGYQVGDVSLDIAVGTLQGIRIVSSDGQTYTDIADSPLGLAYVLHIAMDLGAIKGWTISWGECSGADCLDEGTSGTRKLDVEIYNNDPFADDIARGIEVPSGGLFATPGSPIGETNDSAALLQLCNDWLALEGTSIEDGASLSFPAKVTFALDAVPEEDLGGTPEAQAPQGPYSFPPSGGLVEVDYSKTFNFWMPVR